MTTKCSTLVFEMTSSGLILVADHLKVLFVVQCTLVSSLVSASILERKDNQRIEQTTGANRFFVCYSGFNKPSAAATRAGRAGTIRTFSGNNIDSQ